MRIVVIGSGNVAQALCKVISESEMELVQVFAPNSAKAEEIANRYYCSFSSKSEELIQADLYILAVPEECITSLSAKLDFGCAVVVHTSGISPIEKLHASIVNKGVIYPLHTFIKERDCDFRSIPILIEGITPHATECIKQFAEALSDNVKEYSFEQRLRVNLAAVFASSFSNHMYTISEQILTKVGLPFDLMKHLILESAHKAVDQETPQKTEIELSESNNFARRIVHSDMLNNDISYQTIYIILSNNMLEVQKKS